MTQFSMPKAMLQQLHLGVRGMAQRTHRRKASVQEYIFRGKNTQRGTKATRGSKVGSVHPTMGP